MNIRRIVSCIVIVCFSSGGVFAAIRPFTVDGTEALFTGGRRTVQPRDESGSRMKTVRRHFS